MKEPHYRWRSGVVLSILMIVTYSLEPTKQSDDGICSSPGNRVA